MGEKVDEEIFTIEAHDELVTPSRSDMGVNTLYDYRTGEDLEGLSEGEVNSTNRNL